MMPDVVPKVVPAHDTKQSQHDVLVFIGVAGEKLEIIEEPARQRRQFRPSRWTCTCDQNAMRHQGGHRFRRHLVDECADIAMEGCSPERAEELFELIECHARKEAHDQVLPAAHRHRLMRELKRRSWPKRPGGDDRHETVIVEQEIDAHLEFPSRPIRAGEPKFAVHAAAKAVPGRLAAIRVQREMYVRTWQPYRCLTDDAIDCHANRFDVWNGHAPPFDL